MFVAEALNLVGDHLFGSEWTSDEFWSGYLGDALTQPKGSLVDAGDYARRDAARLLLHFCQQLAPKASEQLTEEAWIAAQDLHPPYLVKRHEAAIRRKRAKAVLRDLCARGGLVGSLRRDDGTHSDIELDRWNTENYREWLRYGEVPLGDVFDSSEAMRHQTHHLFIEREGLDSLLSISASNGGVSDELYLSPYMRLMHDTVRHCGITETHHSKIDDVIRPFIDAEWSKRGLPDSNILRKTMATMVRPPIAPERPSTKIVRVTPKTLFITIGTDRVEPFSKAYPIYWVLRFAPSTAGNPTRIPMDILLHLRTGYAADRTRQRMSIR